MREVDRPVNMSSLQKLWVSLSCLLSWIKWMILQWIGLKKGAFPLSFPFMCLMFMCCLVLFWYWYDFAGTMKLSQRWYHFWSHPATMWKKVKSGLFVMVLKKFNFWCWAFWLLRHDACYILFIIFIALDGLLIDPVYLTNLLNAKSYDIYVVGTNQ